MGRDPLHGGTLANRKFHFPGVWLPFLSDSGAQDCLCPAGPDSVTQPESPSCLTTMPLSHLSQAAGFHGALRTNCSDTLSFLISHTRRVYAPGQNN